VGQKENVCVTERVCVTEIQCNTEKGRVTKREYDTESVSVTKREKLCYNEGETVLQRERNCVTKREKLCCKQHTAKPTSYCVLLCDTTPYAWTQI